MKTFTMTLIFVAAGSVAVASTTPRQPTELAATPTPSRPAATTLDFTWRAATDFTAVDDPALARPYLETRSADPSLHGFAVDPMQFKDRFGAAELRFNGPAATYTLVLLAVAEEDGESVYRLAINGVDLPARVNPPSAEKRKPVYHRWSGVALRAGDRVRVYFSGRSNRTIPERSDFAWSRGRWRLLEAFREMSPENP